MRALRIITSFVSGKRVVPSVPSGRSVHLASDAGVASSSGRDGVSGLGLFIEYSDASGAASSRRIACRNYDPGHDAINAWCFERRAPRQFRLDRIATAVCTESGEYFDAGRLLQTLRERGLPIDDKCLGQVLVLLTFLSRCDGVKPCETSVIETSVERFALRFDGDDALVGQGQVLMSTLAPDGRDFTRALAYIAKRGNGPRLARFISNEAAAVIDADGRFSAEENEFGSALGEALTRIAQRA